MFQCCHECVPPLKGTRSRDSRPRHHHVHQESPYAAVPVHIGMDVDKDKMPEHDTNGRFVSSRQQLEKSGHGVAHSFAVRRHMHRAPNIDRPVAIAGEIGGAQQSRLSRSGQTVPGTTCRDLRRRRCRDFRHADPTNAFLTALIGLPVAARGKSVAMFAVLFVVIRIPVTTAYALDQLGADAIAFNRQRMIGVGDINVFDMFQ